MDKDSKRQPKILRFSRVFEWLRGDVKKTNSIFKDIVQIGGGEVNPMSKIGKEMNF